jgi:Site-specific recombinase XerD
LGYLIRARERDTLTDEECEILRRYIEWRNTVKPTSAGTRIKQASEGIYLCKILHELDSSLDTCHGKDLFDVATIVSDTCTKNTRQTKITFLKTMMNYLNKHHHKIDDPDILDDIKAGSYDKNTKEHLTREEWEAVLNIPMSAKERAMIALLYDGYHRPGELLILKWSNLTINEHKEIEYIITYKTEKSRLIVQKTQTTAILDLWRSECGANIGDNQYIFTDDRGNQYETTTVLRDLFDDLKEKTNIAKLKPSILRHTGITHDVEQGLPLSYICLRAWGESYNPMINIYTKPDSGKLQTEQHAKNGITNIVKSDIGWRTHTNIELEKRMERMEEMLFSSLQTMAFLKTLPDAEALTFLKDIRIPGIEQ